MPINKYLFKMCEVYSNVNVMNFIDKKRVVNHCNTVYYYLFIT